MDLVARAALPDRAVPQAPAAHRELKARQVPPVRPEIPALPVLRVLVLPALQVLME